MMESCRGIASSLQRSRYVSWEGESVVAPTSVAAALSATATPEEFPHQSHQLAGSGSVPLLLLSPPEASGGETNAAFSFQCPQPTFKKRTHQVTLTQSHVKADSWSKEDPSPLHPGEEVFHLPRSSPVISRRHRPVSWHGGDSGTSAPSSSDTPSPASSLLFPDKHSRLTVTSLEDHRSKPSSCHSSCPQEDKKPRCVSASSGLFRLLSAGLHLPNSGQQGSAEEHGRQSLTRCDATHSSGLSTSKQDSKERRCSIPEFSADTFKTSCELEKENAHFVVVDMVLEVLEGVKWTLRSDQCSPTMDTHRHTRRTACTLGHTCPAEDTSQHEDKRRCKSLGPMETCGMDEPKQEINKRRLSFYNKKTSHRGTHISYVHTYQQTHDEEEEEAENDKDEHQPKTFSILSTDSGFEDCGVDTTLTHSDSTRNAEWLAQQLVLEFKRSWFPSRQLRHGRQSLRSSLQELPGTENVVGSSSSLAEEIRLRTRMRGSLSWAPPRFQIIFTVQPTLRRNEVVALQHFLCAGCGTEVEPKHIKKLRYCDYLGRYFCDCCHSGSDAVIPGRVLSYWDFGRYPVSDFSKQLLDSVWQQPLFDLTCVGKTLYSRVKELDKFRELQDNLLAIKKLLTACRLSGSVMTEFEQFPAHLMEKPHLFSMDDLLRMKKGLLVVQARAVLHSAIDHVEKCELCLARGFICEFCRKRDVIFPFQSNICKRCPVCRACFHKHCFVEKKCPKCARIQSRKGRPDSTT